MMTMKTIGKYILKGKMPVEETDLLKWANWFETAERHVADDMVGKTRVSTVFLGIDHNLFGTGKIILFETMIFGGKHNDYQERYSTWEEAEKGHKRALRLVRAKYEKING